MFRKPIIGALVAAATLLACGSGDAPPVPYGVTASNVGGTAEVRWGFGSTAGVDCFLIQRSEGGNFNFVDYAKTPPGQFYFRDDAVANGEWYYYRVAAFYEEWEDEKGVLSEFSVEAGCLIE